METLYIQQELSLVRDVILRPHNDAAKVYSWLGYEPDARFGNGCLHQSYDVLDRMPGSRILWDPQKLHFAVQLENGLYFDPAWNQTTLPIDGIARTVDEEFSIEIKKGNGFTEIRPFSEGWEGRPYKMIPYKGSYQEALSLLMQDPSLGNRFSITWYEEGETRRLYYYPPDDSLYYYGPIDLSMNDEWVARASYQCNSSPEELRDYFRNASILLQQFRGQY